MHSRLFKSVCTFSLVCSWLCCLPGQSTAQSPPLLPDKLRQLTERLDALEKENAASRAENARLQSFIQGRFPNFTQTPVPPAGWSDVMPVGSFSVVQDSPSQNSKVGSTLATSDLGYVPESVIEKVGVRYENGFVLMDSSDPERTPFKLVVGNFAQICYTNTQLDSLTYVDHLGNVRPVDPRNDISFNRDLLTFSGYAFDPNLKYNIIVWSSGSARMAQGICMKQQTQVKGSAIIHCVRGWQAKYGRAYCDSR